MKYYKVLGENRMPCNGGSGQWYPGKWMPPVDGDIIPCNGYHLCRRDDLVNWIGPEIWEAKGRGDMVECENKVIFREARLVRRLTTWNDRTARLFAADCAEHVLHIYEKDGKSNAPAKAIQAARDYANGLITSEELSAASSAAWSVAWCAARHTARHTAEFAASSAASYAARYAAYSAAWSAARSAERRWQTDRLFYYLDGGK